MAILDHDPPENTKLTQNPEGIERKYNWMGLGIFRGKRKIKTSNAL
jgi:hypothetical protein